MLAFTQVNSNDSVCVDVTSCSSIKYDLEEGMFIEEERTDIENRSEDVDIRIYTYTTHTHNDSYIYVCTLDKTRTEKRRYE